VRAVPLAAFIPSLVVPALLGWMHGAVRVSGQAGPKTWLLARGWWSCRGAVWAAGADRARICPSRRP